MKIEEVEVCTVDIRHDGMPPMQSRTTVGRLARGPRTAYELLYVTASVRMTEAFYDDGDGTSGSHFALERAARGFNAIHKKTQKETEFVPYSCHHFCAHHVECTYIFCTLLLLRFS